MAKEIFTGKIRGGIIKDVIEQTKFWPIKTREKVYGHGKSSSQSYGSMEGTAKISGWNMRRTVISYFRKRFASTKNSISNNVVPVGLIFFVCARHVVCMFSYL
jgi:hypothetical protein